MSLRTSALFLCCASAASFAPPGLRTAVPARAFVRLSSDDEASEGDDLNFDMGLLKCARASFPIALSSH